MAAGVGVRRLGSDLVVYVEARFETHLLSWASGLLVVTLISADAACTSQRLQELLFAAEPADELDGHCRADDGEALLAPLLTQLLSLGVLSEQPC